MAKAKAKKPQSAWQPKQDIIFMDVDNPMFSPAHDVSRSNPIKVRAPVNILESPLGLMAARGHLTAAQVRAGSRFRALWEALGTNVRAMDYSKDPVDGGGQSDPISFRQMEAGLELSKLVSNNVIGKRHFDVLVDIIGLGIAIPALGKTRTERDIITGYLKHGLEDLAVLWGYQTRISPVDERRVAS